MSLVTARQPRTSLNLEGFGLIDNYDKVGGTPKKLGLAPYEQEGSFSEHRPQDGQPGEGLILERLVTGVSWFRWPRYGQEGKGMWWRRGRDLNPRQGF